jgi:hypothetical protein
MIYIALLLLLLLLLLVGIALFYFRIADKYNKIDTPNNRSFHTDITIRGGGMLVI